MIFLGLGTNIGDREENLRQAINKLNDHLNISVIKEAAIYETEPIGLKDQPYFLNTVVQINTQLPPLQLLNVCLDIEAEMGRIRKVRWGPRVIDIDILFYNDVALDLPELVIPHPRIYERKFVLLPLAQLCDRKSKQGEQVAIWLATTVDSSEVNIFIKQQ